MKIQKMHYLKDMLCKELDEIADKGEMSAGDLEATHKLTDTIKNIDKILMLEQSGVSYDDGRNMRNSYGNSYDYRQRDSMGRYSGNDDYSGRRYVRGYYRDGIKDKLEDLMNEAGNEKERKAIRMAMESIE